MRKIKILKRNRIFKALLAIYEYPLTIIEAPMGFGKTTAVRSFLEAEKLKPIWIGFHSSDNFSALLWDKLTYNISKLDETLGTSLKKLGFPSNNSQFYKILKIFHQIDFKLMTPLVIDDFHLSDNPLIMEFLLQIVAEEIDHFPIIIMTRDTTNINFVELLSKGLCCIISHQQLKFTEDEVAQYSKLIDGNIKQSEIKKVYEYTDGWISFIYLIVLGLQNDIPIGMNMTMEELIENVLFNAYDKNIQKFLLKLSIMDDFTSKQAGFVTCEENAAIILRKLTRENAFVFYDEISKTYKIHHVLLDFLRIKQNELKINVLSLYSRLGDWYLKKNDYSTAYRYLYKACENEKILSHINAAKMNRKALGTFLRFDGCDDLFSTMPHETLLRYPFAYLLYIYDSLILCKKSVDQSWEEKLDEVEKYYENLDLIKKEDKNRILAEILIIRKFISFNHIEKIQASNEAITKLLNGKQSYLAVQNDIFTFGSPHYLYLYYREEGTFQIIMSLLSKSVGYAKYANGCGMGGESLSISEYSLETGDLKNIEIYSQKAIVRAELYHQHSIIISANFNIIRYLILEGQIIEALNRLDELEKKVDSMNNPIYNTTIDMCKGYIYASIGQPERIPYWLKTGDMSSADFCYQGIAFNYLVYGKALLSLKEFIKLDVLIVEFEKMFSVFHNQLGLIHNQIFKATTCFQLEGLKKAIPILENALKKAESDQLIMPFAESAPYILEMLEVILRKNPHNSFLEKVYAFCEKYQKSIQQIQYTEVTLSERELDVLSLASQGLNRKKISEELYISQETVKTHFKNIYLKLETNSKVLAIKIAKDRGYI